MFLGVTEGPCISPASLRFSFAGRCHQGEPVSFRLLGVSSRVTSWQSLNWAYTPLFQHADPVAHFPPWTT